MFSASADLYDLIYGTFKDYEAETANVAARIRAVHPEARTILDVACGTGEHARLLSEEHAFDVDGLDLDPAFVRIAQGKLKKGRVYEGNMTSFAIAPRYDVILCLFSSIGYVRTLANVRRTLDRFREHLAPGGVILIEPWFAPGVMEHGRTSIDTAKRPGLSVARMAHTAIEDRLSRIRFEYLIGTPAGIRHVGEDHVLGLFTIEEMLDCFMATGLDATHEPEGIAGRGLFTARTL